MDNWVESIHVLDRHQFEELVESSLCSERALEMLFDFFDCDNDFKPVLDILYAFFMQRPSLVCEKIADTDTVNEEALSCARRFSIGLFPAVIDTYLESSRSGHWSHFLEAFILGVYQCDISTSPTSTALATIPDLRKDSIFLERQNATLPVPTGTANVSQRSVYYLHMNGINCVEIITRLVEIFNRHLSFLMERCLSEMCKLASCMCSEGFDNLKLNHCSMSMGDGSKTDDCAVQVEPSSRIPVSSGLLRAFLETVQFTLFVKSLSTYALISLDDIHNRACFEMLADVFLATHAMKDSLYYLITAPPEERFMDLQLGVAGHTPITNATFEPVELPEDIELQPGASVQAASVQPAAQPADVDGKLSNGSSMAHPALEKPLVSANAHPRQVAVGPLKIVVGQRWKLHARRRLHNQHKEKHASGSATTAGVTATGSPGSSAASEKAHHSRLRHARSLFGKLGRGHSTSQPLTETDEQLEDIELETVARSAANNAPGERLRSPSLRAKATNGNVPDDEKFVTKI